MLSLTPYLTVLRRLVPFAVLLLLATSAMYLGFRLGQRPPQRPARHMDITVVNVGQGEAAWIRTPDDRFILIGGGPPEAGAAVAASLRSAGAHRISLLVLPYPYAEAVGGLPTVMDSFPIEQALVPGYPRVNQIQTTVLQRLADSHVTVQSARAGQVITLGDVTIEILAPVDPLIATSPGAANNSVVLRCTYGSASFLFAGGLESAGEMALLGRAPTLSAVWLRVAHSGARTTSSPEFLRLVRPSVAVISAGKVNSSGYPHADTLQRLQAAGVRLYRTDTQSGDLSFWTDGVQLFTP